jgi:hypothetical protein
MSGEYTKRLQSPFQTHRDGEVMPTTKREARNVDHDQSTFFVLVEKVLRQMRRSPTSKLAKADGRILEKVASHQAPILDGYDMDSTTDYHSGDGSFIQSMDHRQTHLQDDTDSDNTSRTHAEQVSYSMPDFLGTAAFQMVLKSPSAMQQLLKFSETSFCSENIDFLVRVQEHKALRKKLAELTTTIHKDFISTDAPYQVNVPQNLVTSTASDVSDIAAHCIPSIERLFSHTAEHIEQLVYQDIYPRFVRHQLSNSMIRALPSQRSKYQGLGDCFCLTSPK